MKVKRYDATDAGQVMIGMISDTVVCSRIAGIWAKGGLFADPDFNLIGGWCVQYVNEYSKAPGESIRSIFDSWVDNGADETKASLLSKKLWVLSEASKKRDFDTEYLLDVAEKYFNRVQVQNEWERAESELDGGKSERALSRMQALQKITLRSGTLIKPAEEFQPWRDALDQEKQEPLIGYPGRLRSFLGRAMVRDGFVAFMAPDKSFKSWWLLDAAFRTMRARRRLAFFEAGDLSQDQIFQRMAVRSVRRPLFPGVWTVPVSVSRVGKVEVESRGPEDKATAGEAYRAFQKLSRNRDLFRLSCHPNSSLSVSHMESILGDWAREGWQPDVVVIDYADILAPPVGFKDPNEQIDETWKHLRRISQESKCLVLTATQAKATAYNKKSKVLRKEHFSGRKTKLAHVTGMVGINVSDQNREDSVSGLNWIVNRNSNYSESTMIMVAGSLAIGNPCLVVQED